MVLKSCSVNVPFILCETSLVLKNDKSFKCVENILKEIIELITSIIVIL